MFVVFWIALIVAFLIIEIITVGLTTIWFAGGAVVALIAYGLGADFIWQVVLFFVVSLALLYFTRPWAMKYINKNHTKTNYEEAIGQLARVTAAVNNPNGEGTAILNGQEWTARSEDDEITFVAGEMGEVVAVAGVKLILKKVQE